MRKEGKVKREREEERGKEDKKERKKFKNKHQCKCQKKRERKEKKRIMSQKSNLKDRKSVLLSICLYKSNFKCKDRLLVSGK